MKYIPFSISINILFHNIFQKRRTTTSYILTHIKLTLVYDFKFEFVFQDQWMANGVSGPSGQSVPFPVVKTEQKPRNDSAPILHLPMEERTVKEIILNWLYAMVAFVSIIIYVQGHM